MFWAPSASIVEASNCVTDDCTSVSICADAASLDLHHLDAGMRCLGRGLRRSRAGGSEGGGAVARARPFRLSAGSVAACANQIGSARRWLPPRRARLRGRGEIANTSAQTNAAARATATPGAEPTKRRRVALGRRASSSARASEARIFSDASGDVKQTRTPARNGRTPPSSDSRLPASAAIGSISADAPASTSPIRRRVASRGALPRSGRWASRVGARDCTGRGRAAAPTATSTAGCHRSRSSSTPCGRRRTARSRAGRSWVRRSTSAAQQL